VGSVSESLAAFLQQRLASIEQIEIMLLLRSDRTRAWPATDVAQALKMPPEAAAMRLFLLASAGLLNFEPAGVPQYRYIGAEEELLDELAEVYEASRADVAAAVGAPPDPIRSFADAFRLKK
jgi:hypothetical protein